MTDPIVIVLVAVLALAVGLGLSRFFSRQPLSVKGRLLKDAAKLITLIPKANEDAVRVAEAQARMAADDAALQVFKDAVSKL